jgi:hypothetical protein
MAHLTVNDVAAKLGVTRPVAYGLIHLMVKTGILTPLSEKRQGAKGKPCDLYDFTSEHANKLAGLVAGLEHYVVPGATQEAVDGASDDKGKVGHDYSDTTEKANDVVTVEMAYNNQTIGF